MWCGEEVRGAKDNFKVFGLSPKGRSAITEEVGTVGGGAGSVRGAEDKELGVRHVSLEMLV